MTVEQVDAILRLLLYRIIQRRTKEKLIVKKKNIIIRFKISSFFSNYEIH